jgi:hypothetical protein
MKHAGADALDELDDLLVVVRLRSELTERKRGTFYRQSSAFLHFHEDPAGLFADLKVGGNWERLRVGTADARAMVLARLEAVLEAGEARPPEGASKC